LGSTIVTLASVGGGVGGGNKMSFSDWISYRHQRKIIQWKG
jgi:hypothetical protein